MAIESSRLKPSMKALRKLQVRWIEALSSVQSHSRTSTVFFLRFNLICNFIFLTTVQHIFYQLVFRGVSRLGGIKTECISNTIFLLALLTSLGSTASMSCSASIVDMIIQIILIMINSQTKQSGSTKENFGMKIVQKKKQFGDTHSFQEFKQKLGSTILGSFVGSYLAKGQNYKSQNKKKPFTGILPRIRYTLFSTFFIQTTVSFTSKVITDALTSDLNHEYIDFIRGFMVGAIYFLVNTPLNHIHMKQSIIVDSKHRKISKMAAFSFMMYTQGLKSLYAGQRVVNVFNFFKFSLHFTLYFGVNDMLSKHYQQVPNKYVTNPFLASVAATVSTFIISQIFKTYKSIAFERYQRALGSGKSLLPSAQKPVLIETVKRFGGLFSLTIKEKRFHFFQFLTNWLMLSIFSVLQSQISHKSSPMISFISKACKIYQSSKE